MKFKVGDKVKIKKSCTGFRKELYSLMFEVIKVDDGMNGDVCVLRNKKKQEDIYIYDYDLVLAETKIDRLKSHFYSGGDK